MIVRAGNFHVLTFLFSPETDRKSNGIILESKVNHTTEEALWQIRDKKYALKFGGMPGEKRKYTGRTFGVGIAYDKETKTHRCRIEALREAVYYLPKYFNTEGPCYPQEHYMVNLDKRIMEIKKLVDHKKYFSINRGRQYGKTTTLDMLQEQLRSEYTIFYISFEGLSEESFQNENAFCRLFAGLLYDTIDYGEVKGISDFAKNALESMSLPETLTADVRSLSNLISTICKTAEKPVILMIDEVDQAGNQQIFLSFLGMLRSKYLKMRQRPAFQSVILAGVYDIRNLKLKIHSEQDHQKNSPWDRMVLVPYDIAAEFDVNMGFDTGQIKEMLLEYEQDHRTGMNIDEIGNLIYSYTSGYPFLVSRLCWILDEKISGSTNFSSKANAWTREGFLEAVKILSYEKNPLFESLVNKLND